MHGTVMIFLFIIPILAGFANFVVPLQIGAPDMAFPRINALSFWMLPLGGILMFSGFFTGGAAAAGWTSYAPLSEDRPLGMTGSGEDLWLVGLILIGTSSILGAVNFLVTIFKMRAPGMTMFRLPILVWTVLVTSVLVLMATPVFATAGIGALGFSVWAHHMFTTGAVFLPFFSLMTFLIAVPTGVKMFNWVATMFRGQLIFSTPMLFAIGFLTMFLVGGINGAFSAAVPVDFALHDTYWVVAHLHYVLFGGAVFGVFPGFYYLF